VRVRVPPCASPLLHPVVALATVFLLR